MQGEAEKSKLALNLRQYGLRGHPPVHVSEAKRKVRYFQVNLVGREVGRSDVRAVVIVLQFELLENQKTVNLTLVHEV